MASERRVVITGMGCVSSIGAGQAQVIESLRAGRSGIQFVPEWKDLGLLSNVAGLPAPAPDSPLVTRKNSKTASSGGLMALNAAWEALTTSGVEPEELRGAPLPVLVGVGIGSMLKCYAACASLQQHRNIRRVSPFTVPQAMTSSAAANVCVALGVRGESWSISSACSSGAHAIGLGALLIRAGRYDRVLAGAAEEVDWTRAGAFDAMVALSRRFNDRPQEASRPFDRDRDGFVISGGAGLVVLEDLEFARRRAAPVLAELLGWAANSDGRDMVAPSPCGAAEAMRLAMADAGVTPDDIDYVNAHGTSTPQGDPSEAAAMQDVFGARQPWISSTKSTTGHAVGAAGSLELIYTVLMLRNGFLAPSRNVTPDSVAPDCRGLRLVFDAPNGICARTALSNSFGFGGTNACLVVRRWEDSSP